MSTRSLILLCVALSAIGCTRGVKVGDEIGIGAIAGRGIGTTYARNAITTGVGIGKGIGFLIADEPDRAHARVLSTATAANNFTHNELGPLTNTRWRVRTITPPRAADANLGMIVTFRPSGHVVTRTTLPDSTTRLVTERYRVVGDTLIINRDDFVVNAQFRIRGESLTIGAGEFVGVFDRIRSRDGL